MTNDLVRLWYVSSQRLCNFTCEYCVSINDYAKSSSIDWLSIDDRELFFSTVNWIGTRSYQVGVRLATLGEPFASATFLDQVAWLSQQRNVSFIELVTNGSLLPKGLKMLEMKANLSKLSLWITHHPTQISVDRLVDHACLARDLYGCFVVINGLLFADNHQAVSELRARAIGAGLRFNLDLGYNPLVPFGKFDSADASIPAMGSDDWFDAATKLGAKPEILSANIDALNNLSGATCSAGINYFYIGIRGDVYSCSRYQVLDKNRIGNVLDLNFDLPRGSEGWRPCEAGHGCCNKEDFLNLRALAGARHKTVPSLGWAGP
jgi:sulfatase maturation enzyme AslB (radical SAM superfamily)